MGWASRLLLLAVCGLSACPLSADDTQCEALIERSNAQLDAMRRHAAAIEDSVRQLNEALSRAERRNVEQTSLIERLEADLRALRAVSPEEHQRQRRAFFHALAQSVPTTLVHEVQSDRVIIAVDPVFKHRSGELSDEGGGRLTMLADGLRGVVSRMPPDYPWRLRVEGHSDSRPLRVHPEFDSNWELSLARATGVLGFLVTQGLPEDRLSAVGLADTRRRDPGSDEVAHERNRRIEIHLVYGVLPMS